jgi:hypothetical protein
MVLSAVESIRRNIWFEVRAPQCPQRARMIFHAAQGPLSRSARTLAPPGNNPAPAGPGRISIKVPSDRRRLPGPVELFPRTPDAVQNDGQLPRQCDTRFPGTRPFGDRIGPVLQA